MVVHASIGTAHELLDAVRRMRPHEVLTDIRMQSPGSDPKQAMESIKAEHPATGVVVLSQYADES